MRERRTEYDYGPTKHVRLDYTDGRGKTVFWEPKLSQIGLKISDLPLWNGDLLRESRFENEPVLLVEGEKDANRGVMFGFCCVSLPGGAAQRDFGQALEPLRGRDVVLIPDCDQPGYGLMQAVAAALAKVGVRSIKWMPVYDMEPGYLDGEPGADEAHPDHDLSDLLDESAEADPRGARELIQDMIASAQVVWNG
jgi:hypothetical protein